MRQIGFVEKLVELWRLRRRITEDKAEMMVSGTLAKYSYKAGEVLMNKTLTYRSSYVAKVYKAILLQCEKEYE